MRGSPRLLLFAINLLTEYGSGNALESTTIREPEHIGGKFEEILLVLRTATLEHAKEITQLKSENEHLRNDKESLRDDYKKLKNDFENMRKEHENLKSSLEEHFRERDELKLQLNTTEGRLQYLEAITRQITPRTCQMLAELGITRTGEYFVDPDGVLSGEAPIKVRCDMETDPVSTIVLHDSMGSTVIDRCADLGCYSRSMKYGAPMKQIVALIEQSKSCEQQIRYDCFTTALTTGDKHYAWWVDRHGKPQYYWDGSHTGEHVCNCGLTSKCIDPILPCNCDAKVPQWESDSGSITDPKALPIIELRFGGLRFDFQKANYTLGGMVCRGKVPPPENPAESCSSLRKAGSTYTGYYLINSKKDSLDVVMCRMDLEETNPEFQVETSAHIAWGGFTHRKVTLPDNPAESCSSLRQAGNTHSGYYLINSKKGRLDVVLCRMDLEETDPKFQVETAARIAVVGLHHGKATPPDNPAQSCSSLRQAGNIHSGYYLINSKKGRLNVVLCRMDLEEIDPKFQVETSARIAWSSFTHGKVTPPDNPAQSCSTLRQAGNIHSGYYLINSKKGRLDVVLCRMDLEETDSKFQVETSARIAWGGFAHGEVTSPGNPAHSCSSLRQAGNAHPGYYLINSNNGRLDVVMCRMDLEETDPEFQKEAGARIAREGAYFKAYGSRHDVNEGSVVRYFGADVNVGWALDLGSGIFTAPINGIYAFHLHIVTHGGDTQLRLRKNGVKEAELRSEGDPFMSPGNSILLYLNKRDQVDVLLEKKGNYVFETMRFVGYLLYPM
ncbi:unnamed protein product [Darwinula stevensoni]|uniref:C1q domain-containing protein n=1 Tax=Darwinula stevensoni TaxID=69355 RepID=A0A7R8X6K0_9CRUS|nr:unnamed protein product [Darwinula stevensoni]CAG0885961.1 unnamed protein product [Darwinula stevensoni]